jgi:hypothetical protein
MLSLQWPCSWQLVSHVCPFSGTTLAEPMCVSPAALTKPRSSLIKVRNVQV